MKKIKNIMLVLIVIISVIIGFSVWYKAKYSMEEVATEQVHSENLETGILIATQGSDFKRAIVTNIKNHYKLDTVFLKIIDIKELNTINPKDYGAVVILHTWEYGNPPSSVTDFITRNSGHKRKFIVLSTSGKGTNKIEGIDAISGESIVEEASDYSDKIIERINKILRSNY